MRDLRKQAAHRHTDAVRQRNARRSDTKPGKGIGPGEPFPSFGVSWVFKAAGNQRTTRRMASSAIRSVYAEAFGWR